jgi:amidophosphoribosyltransferase
LAGLDGHIGIGHTRYSTTGSNCWENAQPVHRQVGSTSIALAHNGNLTNAADLARRHESTQGTTDSELMVEAITRHSASRRLITSVSAAHLGGATAIAGALLLAR